MPPVSRIWPFLKRKSNGKNPGWIGSGFVILAAGLWTIVTYLWSNTPQTQRVGPAIEANCNALAVGWNVNTSTIEIYSGENSGCTTQSK